jgi:hypothetical protein
MPERSLDARIGEGWLKLGRVLNFVGRAAGAIVGLISAAIDGYHAWDEFKHGNTLLGILYTVSAGVGMVLVATALAGSVIALPLLVLAAIIGVVINYVKGREINEWLEQCYFGIKEENERFSTLAEDQKLASALS